MATCNGCGWSSKNDGPGITVEQILTVRPIGTWSVAGAQLKAPATLGYRMSCDKCGWRIDGYLRDGAFFGDPTTQVFGTS